MVPRCRQGLDAIDIEAELRNWGEWLNAQSGPPSTVRVTAAYSVASGHTVGGYIVVRNVTAEALDKLIAEMGQQLGSHMKWLVVRKYANEWTDRRIGREVLHASESTATRRLEMARDWLVAALPENWPDEKI